MIIWKKDAIHVQVSVVSWLFQAAHDVLTVAGSVGSEKVLVGVHVVFVLPDFKDASAHHVQATSASTKGIDVDVFILLEPSHFVAHRVLHWTTITIKVLFLTIFYCKLFLWFLIWFPLLMRKLLSLVFKDLCVFNRSAFISPTNIISFW